MDCTECGIKIKPQYKEKICDSCFEKKYQNCEKCGKVNDSFKKELVNKRRKQCCECRRNLGKYVNETNNKLKDIFKREREGL